MRSTHPLDLSLALSPAGPQLWHSPSSPLYWNTIGPYGGWIAAMLLHAVLCEEDARGVAAVDAGGDFGLAWGNWDGPHRLMTHAEGIWKDRAISPLHPSSTRR